MVNATKRNGASVPAARPRKSDALTREERAVRSRLIMPPPLPAADKFTPSNPDHKQAYGTLVGNLRGRYGAVDPDEQAPKYFQTIVNSLKPGEAISGPVGIMLELINRAMFTQDQVVPAYQIIDKFSVSGNDRLKVSDRFFNTLSRVEKTSPSPGMGYDNRLQKAQEVFAREMPAHHDDAGYSQAELKAQSNRLNANHQGRYGALDSSQQGPLYFGTVIHSLKPGEPVADAVGSMLKIVNAMMFTQDQVVPVYTLIDRFAKTPDDRLKLTEKFLATLAKVQATTPAPGMTYDTRPKLAQQQFEKERSSLAL